MKLTSNADPLSPGESSRGTITRNDFIAQAFIATVANRPGMFHAEALGYAVHMANLLEATHNCPWPVPMNKRAATPGAPATLGEVVGDWSGNLKMA